MRIRYLSDLHNEFRDEPIGEVGSIGEDVVVLAGDIDLGTQGIYWAQKAFAHRPVLYVLGNHEFYGRDWNGLISEARAAAAGSNVHLLEQDSLVIGGMHFLGCSLWTDLLLWGENHLAETMGRVGNEMTDYDAIMNHGRPLLPSESAERNQQSVAWLRKELEKPVPTVVVTHHAPTQATADPKYKTDVLNAAFHSHLDNLVRPPVLAWIHGHSHYSCRRQVNGIPVLVNTHGYPGELHEDPAFRWDAFIDLDPAAQ